MKTKATMAAIVCAFAAQVLVGQPVPHVPLGIVSDWTHHHVLYPDSRDFFLMARIQRDPRWVQNWYLRHQEAWWPELDRRGLGGDHRDWSVPLSASPATSAFEPLFDFAFSIGPNAGYGSLNTTDDFSGQFLATSGILTVTGGGAVGVRTRCIQVGQPKPQAPAGAFLYDDVLYPSIAPAIDNNGPLFIGSGLEINILERRCQ